MKISNFIKTSNPVRNKFLSGANGVKKSNGVNIAINGSRLRSSATLGTTAGKSAFI